MAIRQKRKLDDGDQEDEIVQESDNDASLVERGARADAEKNDPAGDEGRWFVFAVSNLLAISASRDMRSQSRHFLWKQTAYFLQTMKQVAASFVVVPEEGVRGILACFPPLLQYGPTSIMISAVALIGALSVNSHEIAQQMACDKLVIIAVLRMLETEDFNIATEVYHCVVNLVSTMHGRIALRCHQAVEKLMVSLFQNAGFILHKMRAEHDNKVAEMIVSDVLHALDALIFHDSLLSLKSVPENVRVMAFRSLQRIWKELCNESSHLVHGEVGQKLLKLLMWLALELKGSKGNALPHAWVLDSFVQKMEADIGHFLTLHWESSPCIWREIRQCNDNNDNLCNDLLGKPLQAGEESLFLEELVMGCLSCPLFSSDELDASCIFGEIQGELSKSMVIGQDLRLVKSMPVDGVSSRTYFEEDYYGSLCDKDSDSDTFVQAYEKGYTLALRGLEFRFPQVAAIAQLLAARFGQASVGANLYMTPPDAQGFALHADDHCVLIWQLFGSKSWRIFPALMSLPRLYSQKWQSEEALCHTKDAWNVLLEQGDLLYIPRGFPHKATTKQEGLETEGAENAPSSIIMGHDFCSKRECHPESSNLSSNGTCNCINKFDFKERTICKPDGHSVHITFGIEVEPPFDWEGFFHIAVEYWSQRQHSLVLETVEALSDCKEHMLELCIGLLHVAIRCCGDEYNVFRKACLIASNLNNADSPLGSFELFYGRLVKIVAETVHFKVTIDAVLDAMDSLDGKSLDWMCWFRHLHYADNSLPSVWVEPMRFFRERLSECLTSGKLQILESSFLAVKTNFITHADFTETCKQFESLLKEYRSVRKRFTKGMLALHNGAF